VLLSRVWRYYECKFGLLLWLMFFNGADAIYRTVRKSFKMLGRLAPFLMPKWSEQTDEEYIADLPRSVRADAQQMGVEAFLMQFTCDADVERLYGEGALFQLWQMWNEVDPRYLAIKLKGARGLPPMDSNGLTDAYVVAYLVPPSPDNQGRSAALVEVSETPSTTALIEPPPFTKASSVGCLGPTDDKPIWQRLLDMVPTSHRETTSRAAVEAAAKEAEQRALTLLATRLQAGYRGKLARKQTDELVERQFGGWATLRTKHRQTVAVSRCQRLIHSADGVKKALRGGHWRAGLSRMLQAVRNYFTSRHMAMLRATLTGGPLGAPGQYGRTCSRVRKKSLEPVWNQWIELRLEGGYINDKGVYDNPTAPYTALRLEVWDNDTLSRDDFIGEVTLPLTPLMDARPHEYSLPLIDPEGKSGADDGVSGELSFSLKYES